MLDIFSYAVSDLCDCLFSLKLNICLEIYDIYELEAWYYAFDAHYALEA